MKLHLAIASFTVLLIAMLSEAQQHQFQQFDSQPFDSQPQFKLTMLKKLNDMRAEAEQSNNYHKTINKNKNKLTVVVPTQHHRYRSKNLGYTEPEQIEAYGTTKSSSGEYGTKNYRNSYDTDSMMPKFPKFPQMPQMPDFPKIKIPIASNNIDIYIRNTNTNENKRLIKAKASADNRQANANANQNANYKSQNIKYSQPEPYYPQAGYRY